jgi:hypothetical protein
MLFCGCSSNTRCNYYLMLTVLFLILSFTKFQQARQCMYNVKLRRVRESLLQWKSNKYYLLVCVCVRACVRACVHLSNRARGRVHAHKHVALIIQHAKRIRHIVTSFVASSSPPYYSALSHKWCDFRKKKLLNVKCVLQFSLQHLSKTFPILRRI